MPGGVLAAVSSRDDNRHTLLPCLLDRIGEWVDAVVLRAIDTVGEFNRLDVETRVVLVSDNPVDRCDDLADVGNSVRVADLDVHDVGVRCHAEEFVRVELLEVPVRPASRHVVAGDDPSEVGAVTEAVQVGACRILRVERKVRTIDDLARVVETLDRRHARVDQCDADALAGET